jgi:aerobic carbon-monoxide dehydrogenase medium subunit
MKPASFDYHAPATLDVAVSLLQRHADDARLLAGGQSLLPMMNFRLATPAVIIDLNRISALAYIESDNDAVRIGSMTRQRAIEFSPIVAERIPLLSEAIKLVGHLPTRSRGTIGGSIANADPAAELPMVLQALEGEILAYSPRGERTITAADLFRDAMTTSLAPDEIIAEIRLPAMAPCTGYAVEEFARRHGDFAIAAVTAVIVRNRDGCSKARLATAGISSHSNRLNEAEQILEKHGLSDNMILQAAETASDLVKPMSDHNASAEFRRRLTAVLTERALRRAIVKAAERTGI